MRFDVAAHPGGHHARRRGGAARRGRCGIEHKLNLLRKICTAYPIHGGADYPMFEPLTCYFTLVEKMLQGVK